MNEHYFVVRETRPHTDSPMKRIRYMSKSGELENAFVSAYRYETETEAAKAMYNYGVTLTRPPHCWSAPPDTKLEIIECKFESKRSITVAQVVKSEQED